MWQRSLSHFKQVDGLPTLCAARIGRIAPLTAKAKQKTEGYAASCSTAFILSYPSS